MIVQRSSSPALFPGTGIASIPSSLSPTGEATAFAARFSKLSADLVLTDDLVVSSVAAVVVTEAYLVSLSPALFSTVARTV